MTKTAQTDAAVTRFLDSWKRAQGTTRPKAPTLSYGTQYWAIMPVAERALFDTFEDFGAAVSARIVHLDEIIGEPSAERAPLI